MPPACGYDTALPRVLKSSHAGLTMIWGNIGDISTKLDAETATD
jgi:hypothetical protein